MIDADEPVKIITIGRKFWNHPQKLGIWAAELLWVDSDGLPRFEQIKDQDSSADNVALEVEAALAGLKRAQGLERPIEVHSVNESVVRTISDYLPKWKAEGWRRKSGPIASLKQWQRIHEICQSGDVEWVKRRKEQIDLIDDYEKLWEALRERENDYAMQRAIARDPYG